MRSERGTEAAIEGLARGMVPFDALTDVVVVIDLTGTILYGNQFAADLLGHRPEEVLGTNIAEYIHPDDLSRALRVLDLVGGTEMKVPVTPALYRVLRADGEWCRVEINASVVPVESHDEEVLILFGRYSGDRDLQDRIMEALTTESRSIDLIRLVPEFGLWRHDQEHYGVLFSMDDGLPATVGDRTVVDLAAITGPGTPWAIVADSGTETVVVHDDLPPALRAAAAAHGLTDCWAIPIPDPLFAEPAVILTWSRVDGPPIEVHRYAVELMERSLTLILQWRQQVSNLRRAARRDPLTGLANRTAFWEVLERLGAHAGVPNVGILYVDLDGFKVVNDLHGHRTGDVVLAEAAERIAGVIRPGDAVARLGGDEFAIVCRDLAGDDDAVAIAERVVVVLDEPFEVDGKQVQVGASVGIATVTAGRLDPDELLDAADRALYRAKRDGRGRWHLADLSA